MADNTNTNLSPRDPQTPKTHPEQAAPTYGWLSNALSWPSLLGFLVLDVTLTITICTLASLSSRWQGFARVPDAHARGENGSPLWDLGALWTAIPSFVFQIFSAYWAWIASALAERQPYVELRRPGGVTADKSILLDYRATPTLWRWFRAFRLNHKTVAVTVLTGLALQFIAAPLSARLFATQAVMVESPAPFVFRSEFNWSALDDKLDWRPVLGTARATLVQDGGNIPWTDDEYAFRPFRIQAPPPIDGSFDMVANTTALSAYLSCETIVDHSMVLKPRQDPSDGDLTVTGSDRGCDFRQDFRVQNGTDIFMKASSILDCSNTAGFSRLVFTTGAYSSSSAYLLSNISVISCATLYQATSGMLRITLPSASGSPSIRSFSKSGIADRTRTPLWRVIEASILAPVVFNPGMQWAIPDFGGVVLYYAQKTADQGQWLSAEVLKQSISRVFTTAYLSAVASQAFDPLLDEEAVQGTVLVPTTKLFVVNWVAYVMVAFLASAMALVCWLIYLIPRAPSIQAEDAIGMVSIGAIIQNSQLASVVSEAREHAEYDGRVQETAERFGLAQKTLWKAADENGEWIIERTDSLPSPSVKVAGKTDLLGHLAGHLLRVFRRRAAPPKSPIQVTAQPNAA